MDNKVIKSFEKSKLQFTKHSKYFEVYNQLFSKYYDKNITLIEIGVLHGGSLEAYKKIFPNARIIGIDKNPKVKELEKYGFEIFIADGGNYSEMEKVFNTIGCFDILIDDGGHTYKQQINTCEVAFNFSNSESIILVEDTHTSYVREFGNKSKHTFQKYAFNKVDKLNNNYFAPGTEKNIYSVEFFESLTVFKINKDQTILKNYTQNNDGKKIENLVDYRNSDVLSSEQYKIIKNIFYYIFRSRWTRLIMKPFRGVEDFIIAKYYLFFKIKENKKLSKYFWFKS